MTLKLVISPITEKLKCLLALQFFLFCCQQIAVIPVHGSLKAGKRGAIRYFVSSSGMVQLCICMIPPMAHMLEDFISITRLWDTSQLHCYERFEGGKK